MPLQVIYITIALLFLAVLPLPLEFYSLLRVVAAGTLAWGAYRNFGKKPLLLPVAYTILAIVYNPVMEINLAREFWIPLDLATALLLLLTKDKIAG